MILWVLWSVHSLVCLLNYSQHFLSWKKCLHVPLPVILPYLCRKLPLLAAILRQQQVKKIIQNKYNNHNNTILYTNIFIEVHRLKFLSDTPKNPHQQTHPKISHAIYYWKGRLAPYLLLRPVCPGPSVMLWVPFVSRLSAILCSSLCSPSCPGFCLFSHGPSLEGNSASPPRPAPNFPDPCQLPGAGYPSLCPMSGPVHSDVLPGPLYTLRRYSSWTTAAAQVKLPVFTSITVDTCTNKGLLCPGFWHPSPVYPTLIYKRTE